MKNFSLTFLILAIAAGVTPAAADFYLPRADGSYLVVPDLLVLIVAGVVFVVGAAIFKSSSCGGSEDVPPEISTPESSGYYDDQAARARALKRKLDAEVDLAKSYIDAARTKAELDELTDILDLDKAKRRAKR